MKDEEQGHLRLLHDGRDHLSVAPDLDERGRGRQVIVPNVVMHELPRPLHPAGQRIEGDERIAVQVGAVRGAAPVVIADLLDRNEERPSFLIDGEVAPESGAVRLVAAGDPGRAIRVARLRFQIERSQRLPCDDVPTLDGVALDGLDAALGDEDVPVDHRG